MLECCSISELPRHGDRSRSLILRTPALPLSYPCVSLAKRRGQKSNLYLVQYGSPFNCLRFRASEPGVYSLNLMPWPASAVGLPGGKVAGAGIAPALVSHFRFLNLSLSLSLARLCFIIVTRSSRHVKNINHQTHHRRKRT